MEGYDCIAVSFISIVFSDYPFCNQNDENVRDGLDLLLSRQIAYLPLKLVNQRKHLSRWCEGDSLANL